MKEFWKCYCINSDQEEGHYWSFSVELSESIAFPDNEVAIGVSGAGCRFVEQNIVPTKHAELVLFMLGGKNVILHTNHDEESL